MSVRRCDKVLSAIARKPWAITPDGLELVLGIAHRHASDMEAVLATPTARRESGSVQMRDGVAVISVMGPLFPRADVFTEISGATSVETLALRFGEAVAADDVKGIVLHIDSPGGQITGVHEFASQIFAARHIKPVVTYVSGMCASAAYWIGSASQRIVADETGELGSIGVVCTWTDDKESRKSKGLTDYEVVSSQSPNKRLDPTSEEGRSVLQRRLDEFADIFIADVSRHRDTTIATVAEQFGQGGMMLAAEAVRAGMADEMGSLEDVIAALSGNAKLTNRDAPAVPASKEKTMDKAELAAAHPELLAQIQAEARAEADTQAAAQLAEAKQSFLAVARVAAGDEAADRVDKLLAAGLTAEQVTAFAAAFGDMAKQAGAPADAAAAAEAALATQDKDSRDKILAALRQGTPPPVNTSATVADANPALAAIERMSKINT